MMNYKGLAGKAGDFLNNYSHMATGVSLAGAVTAYHLWTHRDLGANFVTFAAYFYGFLAGHAFTFQKWPDSPGAVPTAVDKS